MWQIKAIILVAWFTQVHATEPVAQNISSMQDSTDAMIDAFADVLLNRALQVGSLRGTNLDDATFAKVLPQTRPMLPVHHSSSPVSWSRAGNTVPGSFVPVGHNSLQIPRSLTIPQASHKGFVKEGSRIDKVSRRKRNLIITKVMTKDIDKMIADELGEMEQLKDKRIDQQKQTASGGWIR